MANCLVFASGRGSNFRALYDYSLGHPGHQIVGFVTDQKDCLARSFANEKGIADHVLSYKGRSREDVERDLLPWLESKKADLLVFAGFMRLVSPVLVDAYKNRIVNIHPSLLPKYPGTHGIADSYQSGDTRLGITIHYVDYGMDTGPIIVQESFDRAKNDSLESIEEKIHRLEHEVYPETVWNILELIEKKR